MAVGDTVVVGVGTVVGDTDGDTVGLTVGTVSANSSSFEGAGSNRTIPAPRGGTASTVHPVPLDVGVHVAADRSPTVTSTVR